MVRSKTGNEIEVPAVVVSLSVSSDMQIYEESDEADLGVFTEKQYSQGEAVEVLARTGPGSICTVCIVRDVSQIIVEVQLKRMVLCDN